jgi:hypothetical protein
VLFWFVSEFLFSLSFKTMQKPSHVPSLDLPMLGTFAVLRQAVLQQLLGAKVDMALTLPMK